MTHDALHAYPFLGRVINTQRDFLRDLGVDVPAELIELQKNACLEVHRHSPSNHATKEAIMTVIVLASSPPQLYDRVEASGDVMIRRAVQELRAANPQDPLTPLLSQAKTAIGIAMMRLAAQTEMTAEQARAMYARGLNNDAEEVRNFSNLDAPALREEYARTKRALMARLQTIFSPAPPSPPRRPGF